MIESPPSFVVRTELYKGAFDKGFRIELPSNSTVAPLPFYDSAG
jgi:hypothetical protein